MNPEELIIHVQLACSQLKIHPSKHVLVHRYCLHMIGLKPRQIAEMTNTSHIKVYDSIKRVRTGQRFNEVKERLNQIL